MMKTVENRRPLASRQTGWAAALTRQLAATSITPNQISILAMAFAAMAGGLFWASGSLVGMTRGMTLILAALFVQLRLLCNLLDGMVAIEAGRSAADGGFWNECPDRISDALILIGVALAIGQPTLGWAAVSGAFLTAYIRELGVNCGVGADFSGPMAKQHRMALVTCAAVASAFTPLWGWHGQLLYAALWMVVIGTVLTSARRAIGIVNRLKRQG